MQKHRYFTAQHREILMDSLATEKPIEFKVFRKLITSKLYIFYAYDERINAKRYILVDMAKNLGLPTWLHVYNKKI